MKLATLTISVALALSLNSTSYATTSQDNPNYQQSVAQLMQQTTNASKQLQVLTEQYVADVERRYPLLALVRGDHSYNHLWPNELSPEFIAQGEALTQAYTEALAQIDRSELDRKDAFTYDIFVSMLEVERDAAQFPDELLPVNQFIFSPQNLYLQLASGSSVQPFNTAADFDAFLQRSRSYVTYMYQAIENMRKGIAQGIVHARPIVESMLPQFQAEVHDDANESALLKTLHGAKDKLSEQDYERLVAEYTVFVNDEMTPMYQTFSTFIADEYLPAARETFGYSSLPNGKAWYENYIKQNTTLTLSADEIHQTGLNEVARIQNEMREIMAQVGFDGSLDEFFNYVKNDPKFYFNSSEEVLEAFAEVKERMSKRVELLFDVTPAADYVMRSYPESQAKSAPGASYLPPTQDGSRPGMFFINTYDLAGQPKFGVETLSIHEAAPGHHFQKSIQMEIDNGSALSVMTHFTAYTEGWALYAESLGKELGFFTDPMQYFGKLDAELFRAIRLVVDTGIHAKGWSREQAIDYMLENSSMARSSVVAEIERYMILPGQALSYKTGQLKLQELRDYAEAKLGDDFDIKTFHNLVLLEGPMPLPMLEQKIKRWVSETL